MTAPAEPSSVLAALVPVDERDVAFALLRALSRRRFGHRKAELDSVRNHVVAETIAEALIEDGYILARKPVPPEGPGVFSTSQRS